MVADALVDAGAAQGAGTLRPSGARAARYTRAMKSDSVVAVVLAGGDVGDRLAADAGVEAKALIPLGEEPLGAYVLRALRASGSVSHIVYVGPTNARLDGLYDLQIPSGHRMVDSLALGLGAALAIPGAGPLLLLGADIPWVTGDMLSRFVAEATTATTGEGPAQLVYPVVREAAAVAQFPEQKRTYARLLDGKFTGGNLVLMHRGLAPALLPQIDRVFRARKNPFALAGIVGIDVLFRLLSGRADIARLERRVSRLVDAPVRALISDDAALAADVDSPAQLPGTLTPNLPSVPEVGS